MSNTILEQTRSLHEDIERFERLIVKDLKRETVSHQEKLFQSHRIRKMLESTETHAAKLIRIYEDNDHARRDEIAALAGDNVFSNFYERLNEVRDYHRRYPKNDVTEAENDEDTLKLEPSVEFSGEEAFGKYVDLHELYNRYINSKFGEKLEYYEYLTSIMNFDTVSLESKMTAEYKYVFLVYIYHCLNLGNMLRVCWSIWSRSTNGHIL